MLYLNEAEPGAAAEPLWLDLPNDVRVQVMPLTTAIAEAAANAARKAGAAMAAKAEEAEALGTPLDPLGPTEANASWVNGRVFELQIFHLAMFGIIAWEGVGDRRGVPLPVSPASLQAFAAHPSIGPIFLARYYATLDERVAEGNACAPSSDGSSEGPRAPDTAEPAPDAEHPAPTDAGSAPAS